MSLADRRTAMRLAVGSALLPLIASRPAMAHILVGDIAIAPPAGDMIYRRFLRRQMAGGAWIECTRDFSVHFEQSPQGYILAGRQIAAFVEAPANLAQLAALEEQRVEDGVFPVILDANGIIVRGAEPSPSAAIQEALSNVQRLFEGRGHEVSDLVEVLHNTGAQMAAVLPSDLFAPTQTSRAQRQEIVLPWGGSGEVETQFSARRDTQTHLMREAQRDVVTRLDGDERHSTERWEFLPA